MKVWRVLNPNEQLPLNSLFWYVAALLLMSVSIVVCVSGWWQTDGFVKAIYVHGTIEQTEQLSRQNAFSITPRTMSIVWAIIIYGALLARRYVRNFSNLPTLLLIAANITFVASIIEAVLPAQSIPMLTIFGKDILKVNPQTLLVGAVMLSWVGMRALSGFSIIILGWALLARSHDMNQDLGVYGSIYVMCGFLSFLIQAKLPYMIPEGGWCAALFQDFGAVQIAAARNVTALKDAATQGVQNATSVVAAANGVPLSK